MDGKKILEQMSRETGGRLFEVSGKQTVEKIYAQIEEVSVTNTAWDTRRTGPIPARASIRSASRQGRKTLWSMPERNITGDSKFASKIRNSRPCTNESLTVRNKP